MKIFYTGVGNRDTPHEYLEKMTALASLLEKKAVFSEAEERKELIPLLKMV